MVATLLVGSVLTREDGKAFRVIELAHWSLLRADDGEEDRAKWIGGNEWIGQDWGNVHTYTFRIESHEPTPTLH